MKYVSQTMDIISYKNGSTGTSITAAYTRYYLSTSNQKKDAPADTESGWETDFDEVLENYYAKKKEEEAKEENERQIWYIWSQDVHKLSDNTFRYSTPTVNSANSVIANWCMENDKTKINGSNIATGTLSASQITTGTLDAGQVTVTNLDASQITTGKIDAKLVKVDDLTALDATIGGWTITEDGIDKKDANGVSMVGMYSGDVQTVNSSPVRFYAGSSSKEYEQEYVFDPDMGWTIVLPVDSGWEICSVELPETATYSDQTVSIQCDYNKSNRTLTIEHNEALEGGIEYTITCKYIVAQQIALAPFKVLEDGQMFATSGEVGGWHIDSDGLSKSFSVNNNTYSVGLYAAVHPNGFDDSTTLYIAKDNEPQFYVRPNGRMFAKGCVITSDGKEQYLTVSQGGWRITTEKDGFAPEDIWSDILYSGELMAGQKKSDWLLGNWSLRAANKTLLGSSCETELGSNGIQFKCNYKNIVVSPFDNSTLIEVEENAAGSIEVTKDYMAMNGDWAFNGMLLEKEAYNEKQHFITFGIDGTTEHFSAADIIMQNGTFHLRSNEYPLSFYGIGVNKLLGTWQLQDGSSISSDINCKNSITNIDEKYNLLFDNLHPVIHKYNHGQSGRYHCGYIAQEVGEAIIKAGLTRQDFAALCVESEGLENEQWALRYTEFVPLNTWQIQKLKTRVFALEEKIQTIEADNAELKEQLNSLLSK